MRIHAHYSPHHIQLGLFSKLVRRLAERAGMDDIKSPSRSLTPGLLDVKVRFFFSLFYIFRDLYITLRKQKRNHISKEISLF